MPDIAILRKTCLQRLSLGWNLGIWISGGCPPFLIHKSDSPCLNCGKSTVMLNIWVPSGSLKFWCVLGRWHLLDQSPITTLGIQSLRHFPGRHFTQVVTIRYWKNEAHPGWLHRRGLVETYAWFPLDFATCAFWFC